MKLSKLSLRIRVFLFFALLMVASVIMLTGAIYMAHQSDASDLPHLLATYTSIAAVIIVLILILVWQLFDRHIAGALQSLARHMQTAIHANESTSENSLKHNEQYQYLGNISQAADELISAYHQLKIHSSSSDSNHSKDSAIARQFAAILRDLEVGVVIMNRHHEILLYNQQALRIINKPDCFGLARSILSLFADTLPLQNGVARFTQENDLEPTPHSFEIKLNLRHSGLTLKCNVGPVIDINQQVTGYTLLIDPQLSQQVSTLPKSELSSESNVSQSADIPSVSLPQRPEFYDFDLFERAPIASLANRPLKTLDYVVFDTETTGLNPSGGDEIISIGAVRIINGRVLTGECFDELIKPNRSVPTASTVFHGLTDAHLIDKPSISEVLPRFREFIGESVLIAHNAAFDMKFLELQSRHCNVKFTHSVLDTVLLSAFLHDHSNKHTLDDLATRYGIDITGRHTALGDALATAEIFTRMLDQLACREVSTLNEALTASDRMTHIKRHQKGY